MKVFTDTNFLVSAFASRGLSTDVFQLVLTKHELVTGEFNLIELKRVLSSKIKLPSDIIEEIEQLLRNYEIVPIPNEPSIYDIRDDDDKWILASAVNAKAQVLITEDKDLLTIADVVTEIKIVSPRSFWELLL